MRRHSDSGLGSIMTAILVVDAKPVAMPSSGASSPKLGHPIILKTGFNASLFIV